MFTQTGGARASGGNGVDPAQQAVIAYRAALRDDPVLVRLRDTALAMTVATAIGPIDALEGLTATGRIVMVGPPGSGKTSALRLAVLRLADAVAPEGARTPVPAYVDLATARDGEGADALVARTLAAGTGPGASVAPTALFLDNLDKVTDVYLLEGLELLSRAGGRAGPNVVLACREAEWPAFQSWFGDVPVVRILPLSLTAVRAALPALAGTHRAGSAVAWLDRDGAMSAAVRRPLMLSAFLAVVHDRTPETWQRAQALDALLELSLSGVPASERKAYRAALADVALDSLGRGNLVEVDTVAMGLGVTRDDMIRTGVVVPRGSALEFVEPLLAQHCAASRLVERAAVEPSWLAERLGDLATPERTDMLVHVYSLAPDPVAFLLALLPLPDVSTAS